MRGKWGAPSVAKTGNLFFRHRGKEPVQLDGLLPLLEAHCSQLSLSRFDQSSDLTEISFNVSIEKPEDLESIRGKVTGKFPGMEFTYLESAPVFEGN